ncbi:FecCD family ABC transporter permease [Cumulibacter soli]|uniref:FecCD family ABC transporter permease n=1 Tax=Cumulibacter soli TaxID=2546344 RepID=UPI001FBA769A|nr:iron chelate uptake ABC transporter family permease subunit [Cumulibacter soli]
MTSTPVATERSGRRRDGRSVWTRGGGLLVGLALLAIAVLLSLAIGSSDIPFPRVIDALFGHGLRDDNVNIWGSRFPRTVVSIIVGAALAVAGVLIQALTRNPLADPGILGVNAGAALFVTLSTLLFGIAAPGDIVWFAIGGALLTTIGVYAIGAAHKGGSGAERLTLAGVAVGAVLMGVTTGIMLENPSVFDQMRSWLTGSVLGRSVNDILPVLPLIVLGLLLAIAVVRPLNAISLGQDTARALGVNLGRARVVVVIAVALLAGSATAIAGPILFVGLMVPHVVRWITGPDQRWVLAGSLIVGPLLMVTSDVVGRVVLPLGEIPVGIVTAFVGAPVLILLARRRNASES